MCESGEQFVLGDTRWRWATPTCFTCSYAINNVFHHDVTLQHYIHSNRALHLFQNKAMRFVSHAKSLDYTSEMSQRLEILN